MNQAHNPGQARVIAKASMQPEYSRCLIACEIIFIDCVEVMRQSHQLPRDFRTSQVIESNAARQ
jgi:hypothetical protein